MDSEIQRIKPFRAIVMMAVKKRNPDADESHVDIALDSLTSDRPILDWITSGEFLKLIKAILEIISMF